MKAVDVSERVLVVLAGRGARTLEDLFLELADVNWVQLSLALDKLLRAGEIAMWRSETGDYRVIAQCPVLH